MVRLEACTIKNSEKGMPGFNSTMVRLEVWEDEKIGILSQFQFHDGTIRSQTDTVLFGKFNVSIPRWYD